MSGTRAWVVIKTRDDSYSPVYASLTEEIPPSRGKCSSMMNKNLLILCINHRYLYGIFKIFNCVFSSVQSSHSVMSDYLQPHKSQHARPPCPPTPRVYSNSCPSSPWCHPAISSSVAPFSSCPQSLPASGSSPMSQLFAWGGQSTGVSASAPVLPMNTQDWSPLGWVCTHIYIDIHTHTRMRAWLYSLYSFSIVAVTNHHKLSSLR